MSTPSTTVFVATFRRACAAGAALALCAAAHADGGFTHPALQGAAAPGWQQAREAAPRFVGHPASPRWAVPHANGEHPAVLLARQARPAVDPNTFLVQPPASVRWLDGGDDALAVALGREER